VEVSADELRRAVEQMHGCRAVFQQIVPINERFSGEAVWQGAVHVFTLTGHPTATTAYAWSSPVEGSSNRRFYAVLEQPPIHSAADAVRASIVADHRKSGQ
jgi:hypothetical protein